MQIFTRVFNNKCNMSELSKYIQKQLTTILNKIHETPPKKCTSMKKIKNLVSEAPLSQFQRGKINKSINKIQSALLTAKGESKGKAKSKYMKNLFYQNMFLEEKNMNTHKMNCQDPNHQFHSEYNRLLQKLQQTRVTRLKRQQYLNELIIKTQKLQRMVNLRQQNQQKYLKSKLIQEYLQQKKGTQQNIKKQITKAVKSNNVRVVQSQVLKFNNFIK